MTPIERVSMLEFDDVLDTQLCEKVCCSVIIVCWLNLIIDFFLKVSARRT